MSKSVSIKKSIPVSETGSKAVFKIRNSILSTVVISLMSSVAWADASVQKLSLQQAIEKTAQYQQSQGVWQTQQKINDANIKQSKLWINPELSIEQTWLWLRRRKRAFDWTFSAT